ncbi:MAG TPA: TIR domain-containing protein [Pyrinomonadaceae bacterium]|nr:TIR domain-containing protein [Pyrinomonadaceae bacterium]
MSSPPTLNQDAFISYTHAINLLHDPDGNGWVDNFHKHLEVHLLQFTGRKVTIWRDPQMPGNADLPTYLRDRINDTFALVAILSPGYLNSEWCMGEWKEFCKVAAKTGGLHLKGKSRIFAVVQLPPDGNYPSEIADQLRYEFFETNSRTRRPDRFRADLRNRDERYWLKLEELAWDLKELLKEADRLSKPQATGANVFGDPSPIPEPPPIIPKKTIYLAETTADLAEQRRQIKEELKLHYYRVLPEEPLPYVFDAYSAEVKKNLAEADVSINLLGRTYGIIPEGAGDSSVLRLQVELANERAKSGSGFKRLIWMPEGWEASDDKMGQMLQQVKQLTNPHKGIEFLQTSLEEFKTLMHKRLTVSLNGHVNKTARTDSTTDLRKVYVICDRRDVADAKPLISYLQERYEVVLPEFEEIEGETPLAELHQQSLLECDGVIVYYGHGSSRWAKSKRSDIEKHAGLEKTVESTRVRPLCAKAFYVTLPSDDLKDIFKPGDIRCIKNFGDFDPHLLKGFINDLEGGNDK